MHVLPIFPIAYVLFPTIELRLMADERRQIQLAQHCHHTGTNFGIILIPKLHYHFEASLRTPRFATEARILKYEPQPNGKIDLRILGEQRVRIVNFLTGEPYLLAEVEPAPLTWPAEFDRTVAAAKLVPWMRAYFTQLTQLPYADGLNLGTLVLPDDPEALLYRAARILIVDNAELQQWLEIDSAPELAARLLHAARIEVAVQAKTACLPRGERGEQIAKSC